MTQAGRSMNGSPNDLSLWEETLPVLADAERPVVDLASLPAGWDADDPPQEEPEPQASPEEIIALAQQQAERVVGQAQAQADEIRRATRDAVVQAVAEEQVRALQQAIELVTEDLQHQFHQEMQRIEVEASKLCVDLAERIIRRKIDKDDSIVLETVRTGLAKLNGVKGVTVRVNPQCVEAINQGRSDLAGEVPSATSIQITPEDSISPGGATIHSTTGDIDLQIETQLDRLKKAAFAVLADVESQQSQEDIS